MFTYYLKLGWLSIRKNPFLSILMVSAIAVGIGASMTTITVNYLMSGNPIPDKSDQLFYVQLDNWDPNVSSDDPLEPPDQMTYTDAMALMKADKGAVAQRRTCCGITNPVYWLAIICLPARSNLWSKPAL